MEGRTQSEISFASQVSLLSLCMAKCTIGLAISRTDFDGTVSMQDKAHTLFDNFGCGPERRALLAAQPGSGERCSREVTDKL